MINIQNTKFKYKLKIYFFKYQRVDVVFVFKKIITCFIAVYLVFSFMRI